MRDTFLVSFGPVAAIVLGIVLITLFFKAVGFFSGLGKKPGLISLRGILDDKKLTNVFLDEGRVINRVRLAGFTNTAAGTGGQIPYQFNNLAIFETESGQRYLVRPESIKYIEELKEG